MNFILFVIHSLVAFFDYRHPEEENAIAKIGGVACGIYLITMIVARIIFSRFHNISTKKKNLICIFISLIPAMIYLLVMYIKTKNG